MMNLNTQKDILNRAKKNLHRLTHEGQNNIRKYFEKDVELVIYGGGGYSFGSKLPRVTNKVIYLKGNFGEITLEIALQKIKSAFNNEGIIF